MKSTGFQRCLDASRHRIELTLCLTILGLLIRGSKNWIEDYKWLEETRRGSKTSDPVPSLLLEICRNNERPSHCLALLEVVVLNCIVKGERYP